MSATPIPLPVARVDRMLAALDHVRHPRLTRELARATGGFRAGGVIRRYANDAQGRRLEAREGSILWHRGYRPPARITHNAMWWTGGPAITITYSREMRPAVVSDRDRAIAERIGLLPRR